VNWWTHITLIIAVQFFWDTEYLLIIMIIITRKWSNPRRTLNIRNTIAHNLTKWPWSLRDDLDLDLWPDLDLDLWPWHRTRPRFLSTLRNYQAESRYGICNSFKVTVWTITVRHSYLYQTLQICMFVTTVMLKSNLKRHASDRHSQLKQYYVASTQLVQSSSGRVSDS